jgi:hypothetical protein
MRKIDRKPYLIKCVKFLGRRMNLTRMDQLKTMKMGGHLLGIM